MNAPASFYPLTLNVESPLSGKILLTPRQKWEFEANGFFVVPELLNPEEVAHYVQVVDRADSQVREDTKGERKQGMPLELRNAVAFASSEMLELLTHPKGFAYIIDLMGPHIALTTSHLFIRPPSPEGTAQTHKQIGWHRDGPSMGAGAGNSSAPWLYTKIGYFLTDLTLPNAGALRVIPGSHRYGGPAPSLGDNEEPHGATEVKIRAGDAVVFENRVLHAVGPNYTDLSRKNIYMGYCWRYLRPIDYITQTEQVLVNATAEQRQLLGDSSALSFYVPKSHEVPLVDWYSKHTGKAGEKVTGAGNI